jgi:hypothetical protein
MVNSVDLQVSRGQRQSLSELQKKDAAGVFQVVQSVHPENPNGSYAIPDVALTPGLNAFRLAETDSSGNRSKPSNTLALILHDNPATPSDLAAPVTGSDVTLSWTAPADADSAGFRVARNGEVVNEGISNLTYDPATHQL